MKSLPSSHFGALLTTALLVLSGCSQTESDPPPVRPASSPLTELSPEQATQRELAITAKDKLAKTLMGELMQSMGESGPAKSINICKARAPEIANEVGETLGLRIGRTSFQLRNPENAPPVWAESFVAKKTEKETIVAIADGGLGVLLPIRIKPTCLLCHGNNEQVMPNVKAAIVSNFPDDRATDFSEGDLRGYFWIEVPTAGK